MSEGIRGHVQDIKIKGGVHNRSKNRAPDDLQCGMKIEDLVADLGEAIRRHTTMDSWITIEYKLVVGTKINS